MINYITRTFPSDVYLSVLVVTPPHICVIVEVRVRMNNSSGDVSQSLLGPLNGKLQENILMKLTIFFGQDSD